MYAFLYNRSVEVGAVFSIMHSHLSRKGTISRSAFTLIELLIVIAIIAILAVVVVLVLNPAQLLAQARDANRVADLSTLNSAVGLYQTDVPGGSMGSSSVVYTSLPDSSPTCSDITDLSSLPTGDTYACASSSDYRATNGTGWVPIDFKAMSYGAPFGSLPVDPVNQASQGLYYTYETNGTQYEITAGVQSTKYQQVCANESTTYADLCTAGTNLTLAPINFYASSTALGNIPPGTLPFNVSTTIGNTVAGQTSQLTFSGTAGQTVAITFDNGSSDTYPSLGSSLYFYSPTGGQITSVWSGYGNSSGIFVDNYTLPSSGTYTVKLQPASTNTGHLTLRMISYTDATGTIAFNASTTMSNQYVGQTDSLTFSGTASTTIAILFDNGSSDTYPNTSVQLVLYGPSGNQLVSNWAGQGNSSGIITDNYTLPSTGIYTLRLVPWNQSTGQLTAEVASP